MVGEKIIDRRFVPLGRGNFAIVDNEDFDDVVAHNWYGYKSRNTNYAMRATHGGPKPKYIQMHRAILSATGNEQVDHINRNGLDNRKHNIRICTISQNDQNRIKKANTTSKYYGVCWHRGDRKWRAKIQVNRKSIFIGNYKNETEAAIAYNKAALKYYGENARINVINQ